MSTNIVQDSITWAQAFVGQPDVIVRPAPPAWDLLRVHAVEAVVAQDGGLEIGESDVLTLCGQVKYDAGTYLHGGLGNWPDAADWPNICADCARYVENAEIEIALEGLS